jgi:transposase
MVKACSDIAPLISEGAPSAGLSVSALAAIRSHAHFREFAQRLTLKGKPYKVAVTAVMRKLIVILSAMIRNDQPWKHAQTA